MRQAPFPTVYDPRHRLGGHTKGDETEQVEGNAGHNGNQPPHEPEEEERHRGEDEADSLPYSAIRPFDTDQVGEGLLMVVHLLLHSLR